MLTPRDPCLRTDKWLRFGPVTRPVQGGCILACRPVLSCTPCLATCFPPLAPVCMCWTTVIRLYTPARRDSATYISAFWKQPAGCLDRAHDRWPRVLPGRFAARVRAPLYARPRLHLPDYHASFEMHAYVPKFLSPAEKASTVSQVWRSCSRRPSPLSLSSARREPYPRLPRPKTPRVIRAEAHWLVSTHDQRAMILSTLVVCE
jgi:hypothetical protein